MAEYYHHIPSYLLRNRSIYFDGFDLFDKAISVKTIKSELNL